MAKGSRSSVRKVNNRRLKAKVFGPVETARAERLHKKLLEAVAAPKPSEATKMDVEKVEAEPAAEVMDTEDIQDAKPSKTSLKRIKDAKARAGRRRGPKESNKMVFAVHHSKDKSRKKSNKVSKR